MPSASDQSGSQQDRDHLPADSGTALPELHLTLAADWITPSIARSRVRQWLGTHGWPASQITDLVLAVSEAISNSIEHGYGVSLDDHEYHSYVVRVDCHVEIEPDQFRRIVVIVRDEGQWHAPTNDPTVPHGQGVTMMRGCVDDLTIEHGDTGTTTTMRSRPVPPSLSS